MGLPGLETAPVANILRACAESSTPGGRPSPL